MVDALIRITAILLAALLLVVTVLELKDRYGGGAMVLTSDPMDVAEELARAQRWIEAKWLADFVMDRPDLGDAERAAALAATAEQTLNGMGRYAVRFAEGAITGEPQDFPGLLGSLSLDLFVVGDIRDVAVQGWKQLHYGTGDEVVLALSSVGLATTLVPEIDWAPAFLKWLAKERAFTPRLFATIRELSRRALRSGDFQRLTPLAENIGTAALRLGPGPLRGALASVETVDDLAALTAAAKVNARDAYVLAALFGNKGIRRVQAQGGNVAAVARRVKHGSRAVKIAKKTLGAVPVGGLLCLIALSVAMLWWGLRRRCRRKSRNRRRIEPSLNTIAGHWSKDALGCPGEPQLRLRHE